MSTRPSDPPHPEQPAARPTLRVGSAERALQDLREAAATDVAALLNAESERCRDTARQTLGSLKHALADLEQSCDEAIAGNRGETRDSIAGFVERLMAAAGEASEAAAQRADMDAQAEIEQVQAALREMRAELAKEREQLQALNASFEMERSRRVQAEIALNGARESLLSLTDKLQLAETASAQAEAALKDAEHARQELMLTHESQLEALRAEAARHRAEVSRLQQHIDAEKAERARLVAAIQRAVDPGEPPPPVPHAKAHSSPGASPSGAVATSMPAPTQGSVEAAAQPESATAESEHPELVAYIEHLLTTLDAMYAADVSARKTSADLVNRLTQNLRSARTVYRNYVGASEGTELTLFDRQLTRVLANPDDTSFARHLGIAAYECQKAERG